LKGQQYYDPVVMIGQAEYLPDSLRNKIGLPLLQTIEIYEDFARNIPGFLPHDREAISLFLPKAVIFFH
jgi:CCR4-NOT transcription complex subunit 1